MSNQNWEIKNLGEVCDLSTGGTPSRSHPEYFNNGTIKWLVSGDIHRKEIFDCDGRITEEGHRNSSTRYLPLNSVMIALNGQGKTRGTVALLRTKAMCNQSLVSISPKDSDVLSCEYLYRVLDGRYEELRKMTGDAGNERRGLNMPLIRSVSITVPPLSEQKRIVGILDEKFKAIEELKKVTEAQIQDAKELFESRLNEIMENPDGDWMHETVDDVAEVKGGKRIPKGEKLTKVVTGHPYIRVADFDHQGSVSLEDMNYISDDIFDKISRYTITDKDLFISIAGTIGISGIVPPKLSGANLTENACKLVLKKVINIRYLLYFTRSKSFQEQAGLFTRTTAQPKLALTRIKTMNFTYPAEIFTQTKLVEELDILEEKSNDLESIFIKKIKGLEELKKSYLEQAFAGKL